MGSSQAAQLHLHASIAYIWRRCKCRPAINKMGWSDGGSSRASRSLRQRRRRSRRNKRDGHRKQYRDDALSVHGLRFNLCTVLLVYCMQYVYILFSYRICPYGKRPMDTCCYQRLASRTCTEKCDFRNREDGKTLWITKYSWFSVDVGIAVHSLYHIILRLKSNWWWYITCHISSSRASSSPSNCLVDVRNNQDIGNYIYNHN